MNQRKLKFRIGLFLFAAIALFVGSLFFFGLTDFFEKKTHFVSFFDESVRGLNKGSRVRFRGVEIGQVDDIRLSLDQGASPPGIPVIYEIDISRLQNKLGVPVDISDKENYHNAIRDGLAAKLESSSMVTGQLYIDLDFRPDSTARDSSPHIYSGNLHYIPSVPSLLSDVTEQMLNIVNGISQIDFPELSGNINEVLVNINGTLESFEDTHTADNLNGTLLAIQNFIDSGELENLTSQVGGAAGSLSVLMNDLNQGKGTLGEPLAATLNQMAKTTQALEQISRNFGNLIESNTGPVADLEQTLNEIQDATIAFQSLLEFLRRHPNALIFGKKTP
ncbi:MAG: MlaD family protein [Puniceicoccales bacterium]